MQATAVFLVQLSAPDSCINVLNIWQIKKTAGSKRPDFQHGQQSIPSEPWETPGWTEQQFTGTRLHERLQQLVSHGPAHASTLAGQGKVLSAHAFIIVPWIPGHLAPPKAGSPAKDKPTEHTGRYLPCMTLFFFWLCHWKNYHQQQNTVL